jgi:hypothetical protein
LFFRTVKRSHFAVVLQHVKVLQPSQHPVDEKTLGRLHGQSANVLHEFVTRLGRDVLRNLIRQQIEQHRVILRRQLAEFEEQDRPGPRREKHFGELHPTAVPQQAADVIAAEREQHGEDGDKNTQADQPRLQRAHVGAADGFVVRCRRRRRRLLFGRRGLSRGCCRPMFLRQKRERIHFHRRGSRRLHDLCRVAVGTADLAPHRFFTNLEFLLTRTALEFEVHATSLESGRAGASAGLQLPAIVRTEAECDGDLPQAPGEIAWLQEGHRLSERSTARHSLVSSLTRAPGGFNRQIDDP